MRAKMVQWFARVPTSRLVFAGAAGFAALVLALAPPSFTRNENTDYFISYYPVAKGILDGKWARTPDNMLATHHPPGYALLISGMMVVSNWTGADLEAVIRATNVVLYGLIAALLFELASFAVSTKVAVWATVFWVLYPINIFQLKQPNPEPPFILCVIALVTLLLKLFVERRPKLRLAFAVGTALSVAAYLRSVAVFLGPVASVATAFLPLTRSPKERMRLAGMVLLGTLVWMTPWELFVWVEGKQFIPMSSAGPWAMIDGLKFTPDTTIPPLDPADAGDPSKAANVVRMPDEVKALVFRARQREMSSIGDCYSFLAGEFAASPVVVFKFLLMKMARCWYSTFSGVLDMKILIMNLPLILLALVGLVLMYRGTERERALAIILVAFTLYSWAIATLVLPIFRYLTPSMGLLFIPAAHALVCFARSVSKQRENGAAQPTLSRAA